MSSAQKPAKRKAPEKKTITDVLKAAPKPEAAKKQKQQSEGKEKPASIKKTADKKPLSEASSQGDDFVRGAIGRAPAAPRPEIDRDNDMLFGVKPQKKKVAKKPEQSDEARAEKRKKSEMDKYQPGPIRFKAVSVGVKVLACVREIQESELVLRFDFFLGGRGEEARKENRRENRRGEKRREKRKSEEKSSALSLSSLSF